jgi:hypothetical protein
MKEFYTRSVTAFAYALVLLLPLFYNEYLFYLVGFICSLILVFEFIKLISNYDHRFLSRDSGKSNFILYMTFPLYISLFLLSKKSNFRDIIFDHHSFYKYCSWIFLDQKQIFFFFNSKK